MEQPEYLLYALVVMAAYGLWLFVTKRIWRDEQTDKESTYQGGTSDGSS